MKQAKRSRFVFFSLLCLLSLHSLCFAADRYNFAVIYPGQPGTSQEAQPIMDAFAHYLQGKLGGSVEVAGVYFNEQRPALDYLLKSPPQWGIVSLGFYSQFAAQRPAKVEPLASTKPSGLSKDVWRMAVNKSDPDDWKELKGEVSGTMLYATDVAACILFGVPASGLPFALNGSSRPLRALRDVGQGKIAGVVLDELQFNATQGLPVGEKIKVILKSKDLPTAPVVWFGPVDDRAVRLRKVLLDMAADPQAKSLLQLLQTQGFGEPDPDLSSFRLGSHEKCFQ